MPREKKNISWIVSWKSSANDMWIKLNEWMYLSYIAFATDTSFLKIGSYNSYSFAENCVNVFNVFNVVYLMFSSLMCSGSAFSMCYKHVCIIVWMIS